MEMKNKKGFTLIELLVVVAILGALASIGVVQFNSYLTSVKETALEANHSNISNLVNSEMVKCLLNKNSIILNGYSCQETNPPELTNVENFINEKNNIKNPYSPSNNIVGKDPCIAGTIVVASPSIGSYSISYVNNKKQTISSNINSKWTQINPMPTTIWTPINTGPSVCWTPINTGPPTVWTTIVTGANNIWTTIRP